MEKQNGHRYEFGPFRIDEAKRLLLRDGEVMSLTPKVLETLLVLVRNQGEVVDKDTLMGLVWPDTVVEESGLARNISVLRKKLGEGPADHHYIVTVPGQGYRFVALVNRRAGGSEPEQAETQEPLFRSDSENVPGVAAQVDQADAVGGDSFTCTRGSCQEDAGIAPAASVSPSSRSGTWLFLAVLAALILATASFVLTRPNGNAPAAAKILAVLPLMPINSDKRDRLYEFAIAESLILKLSSDRTFTVRPLSSVRRFVEVEKDPFEAGRELKADFVLSSNYQLVNGRIRVTSQLLDVHKGRTVQTFSSESDAADAFALQDAVANDIGNEILERFGRRQNEYAAKRGTRSEEAYRLYLQGMYLVDKKTRIDSKRAIELMDEAIALDPDYGNAWAGKAAAHCTYAHMGGIEPKLAFETAKPAIAKAFELAPNSAETHAILGIISFDYDWEFDKGLAHFRRALELDPQHEMARRWHANRLASLGRYDEALTEIKTLIDINPSGLFQQWDLANILYQSRRYDEAIVQLQRVMELDPNMAWSHNLIWVSYHLNGDHDRAFSWFIKLREKAKADPQEIELYKSTFTASGWPGVLAKYSEISNARYRKDVYDPSTCPNLLASCLIGDLDTAFEYVDDGVKNRDLWMPFLLNDPAFENLRADPRFVEVRRQAGF